MHRRLITLTAVMAVAFAAGLFASRATDAQASGCVLGTFQGGDGDCVLGVLYPLPTSFANCPGPVSYQIAVETCDSGGPIPGTFTLYDPNGAPVYSQHVTDVSSVVTPCMNPAQVNYVEFVQDDPENGRVAKVHVKAQCCVNCTQSSTQCANLEGGACSNHTASVSPPAPPGPGLYNVQFSLNLDLTCDGCVPPSQIPVYTMTNIGPQIVAIMTPTTLVSPELLAYIGTTSNCNTLTGASQFWVDLTSSGCGIHDFCATAVACQR